MRSPVVPPAYRAQAAQAVEAVEPKPGAAPHEQPPRENTRTSRSFAELLAAAEAVQDHVALHRPAAGRLGALQSGLQGAVQGATGFLARQAPWMGLPLLLRRPPPRSLRPREE